MNAHIGHSDDPESLDAIQEVIDQIDAKLEGATPKAGLLFCSVEYEHVAILAAIQAKWPGLPLVGASSDGEMSSQLGFCDDSVLLTVFSGDNLRVHTGVGRNISEGIEDAVAEATKGSEDMTPQLCLTTFAPTTNATEVISALARALGGARCPVLGGLSGDHGEFTRICEFFGSEVLTDSMPILLIEGSVEVSWGLGSGWFPIGEEMTVTKSVGSHVFEIDGVSAEDAYRERYGELPSVSLGEYPLAFLDGEDNWSLRAIMGRDDVDGSLRFAGTIPEGAVVRFTEVVEEGLLRGSEDALNSALDAFAGDQPELALVFTCAARKWVLGSEAPKELELLRAVANDRGLIDLALAGLYCFGEIAPLGADPDLNFHNETCVSVVLGQ